jgi:hypothetical protein
MLLRLHLDFAQDGGSKLDFGTKISWPTLFDVVDVA